MIKENVDKYKKNEDIFGKLKKIAKDSKFKNILGRYYEQIEIREGTVLYKYLNGIEFKKFNDDKFLIFPFEFNKSQLDATKNIFKNELSIIQGPPGTGKTQTILNIISNCVIRGKTIAVVSNNNAAVNNVRDKLIKNGYNHIFALLGSNENKEYFFENQTKIKLDLSKNKLDEKEVAILINELKISTSKLKILMQKDREKRVIKEELKALKIEKAYADTLYYKKEFNNIHWSFRSMNPERIIDFLVDHKIIMDKYDRLKFIDKFNLFMKYGIYKFRELQSNQFDIVLHYQKLYYDLKIEDLENKLAICDQVLMKNKFKELSSRHSEISRLIFNHYLSCKVRKKKIYSKWSFIKNFELFIKDYPVILSTAYSILNSIPKNFKFDYVIVDEASTLDIVKAVLPLSCAKNIIFVGDQKQLSHIPEKTNESFKNKAYDYKNKNIMDSLDAIYAKNLTKTLLKEHYRCHPDIIRFCNLKYYSNNLIVYSKHENKDPVVIIKTLEGNHMREINSKRKGIFNRRELEELNNLICNQEQYDINLYSDNMDDIGLIAPYRLQVEYSNEINHKNIEKDTIHKYQGREKPIIVFSTVLDKSSNAESKMRFVNNSQLVNVAVSRAENQLILISNKDVFYKNGNDIGDLIKYIEYHNIKNIKQGQVISVFDLLYKEYSQKLLARRESAIKIKDGIKFYSEKIIYSILIELLEEQIFNCYEVIYEKELGHMCFDMKKFTNEEKIFINNKNSSVDFVIINKFNHSPILCIEVDGVKFHLGNEEQLLRDEKKNSILKKCNIPLLRIATNQSITKEFIRNELMKLTEKK